MPETQMDSPDAGAGSKEGLRVVDLGAGLAAALVSSLLARMGATVHRIEPEGGDPFYAVYPAYRSWHALAHRASHADLDRLLAHADVCIVGGEDFPGFDLTRDSPLLQRWPQVIVVDLSGGKAPSEPCVELLAQARSGMAWAQFSDRPLYSTFPAASFGAALQAMVGLGVALHARERSGRGQTVAASLDRAATMWYSQYWLAAQRPDSAFERMTPKDVRALIMRGSDDRYVHFAMGVPGAVARVHQLLDIPGDVDPADRGLPGGDRHTEFFGNVDLFRHHARRFTGEELLRKFGEAGLPVEPVLAPGACWNDPQVIENRIIESLPDGRRSVGLPIQFDQAHVSASLARRTALDSSRGGEGALGGLRLVEFGSFVAGPYSARLMADFGADVIKVEPLTGDPSRGVFRTFCAINRGKRCISVDGKLPEGAQIIQRLCARAHAVSHNLRPGPAQRLGVDFDTLRALNPTVVVLATTAYGESGPKAHLPGFDYVMQAYGGHEVRLGGRGAQPLWYRSPIVDYSAGALGAIALLEGLRRQNGAAIKTGVNLLSTTVFLLSELVQRPDGRFEGAPANGDEQLGTHPAERLYRCRDGWVAVAARSPGMARQLWAALQLPPGARPRDRWDDAEASAIAAALAPLTCMQALQIFEAAQVWATQCQEEGLPALDALEAQGDGAVVRLPHAHYGTIRTLGAHVTLSHTPSAAPSRGVPLLGEHTREILAELGYPATEIEDLHARNIVRSPDRRAQEAAP